MAKLLTYEVSIFEKQTVPFIYSIGSIGEYCSLG